MSRILSPNLEYALGWTVVHSLWQATAISLFIAILMIALRKHSAQTRYVVSCAGLFTTLLASVATFCFYFEFRSTTQTAHYLARTRLIHSIVTDTRQLLNADLRISFQDYFNQHLPLIVSVWLMGVALFALRLLSGVSYIAYLKRYRNSPMLGDWQARVEYLSEQLGVNKAVEILESALVKTPMTIGALKPIILFPIGAVTYLSVEQMEAILAHELAHISRNDYFFNILQSIVEIIFYFHPAVWWLSNTIRNERENCCDDIAVSVSGNSLSYAKALVNLQELHSHSPMLAMGFSGKNSKNQLLNRVKRLLNQPQTNSNFVEKLVATGFLLIVFAFTSIHETRAKNIAAAKMIQNNKIAEVQKTPKRTNNYKDGLGTFTYVDDKEVVKWQMRDGEIVQLNINGKEISGAEFPNYHASLKRWKTSIPELITDSLPNHTVSNNLSALTFRDGKNKYDYIIENGEITHLNVNGKVIPHSEFGKYKEFLEKGDAFYPKSPPIPPMPPTPPPVPPTPPTPPKSFSMNSWYSDNNSNDSMAAVSKRLTERTLRIANESLKNLHINLNGDNGDEAEQKCNPCDEERSELKNELKDLINRAQQFDTDDAKDATFYKKMATQLKEIKMKLNNTNIQNGEVNQIRKEMRQVREQCDDFDDSSDDLYPNKKTKYGWQAGFEAELLKDGFIKDANHYSIRMYSGDDEIAINGERKSRQVFLKYQALYEQLTGSKLRRANHIEFSKE